MFRIVGVIVLATFLVVSTDESHSRQADIAKLEETTYNSLMGSVAPSYAGLAFDRF